MSSNPVLWFKEVNGYLRDLVEVYIKKKYTDMIYGLQSWYKKVICKAYQMFPEFKENWSFEGYIGPLNKSLGTNDNTKVSWFQTAALFASGRDELAIKSLSTLRSLGTIDEHGILHMLDRQAIDFYTCLEDYHSIGDILTSAPENDFIYQALHAFNSGEETLKNQEDAFREMQNFVKVAPLEACTKLNRLDDFRHWLVPDAEKNDDITSQITSRMLHTLKDGIFSNITNLLELQLLFTGWEHLVASARDWYDSEVAVNSTLHPVSETKHWARLCTEFEKLYHLNGGAQADSVVTQYMNSIYLHTAKVARRQGNMLLAEKLIEKAAQAPDTKYRALYERTKILFSQSAYAEAMDTLNTIMTHVASVPEYKELASRTYRNIARYLKSSPEDKATSLLEKLDPNFVKRVATEMQSPVEACIDNALEKSIETNTTDGRPWFEYATHHYKQGWRILEEILQPEPTMAIAVWAKAEIQKNLTYADNTVDKKQLEKMIFELLINYSSSIGNDSSSSCHSLVNGLRQLVPFLKPENETNIIAIYDILHKMVIDKFYASAQAYFRYLSLDIHISHNDEVSNTSMVTTATLRLLRILSKYGTALQSIYCEHIDTVRIDLWKRVTPQLFAQLNHPNEFIRQVISKLICRICDEYPREIIYDVIVSSSSSKTNKDTKQALDIIANRMIERNELLWVSTSRMAEEIQRMTILVEEHMMNMIGDLQFDVMGNFTDLDVEIAQLETSTIKEEAEKEKIFFELYDNCMKPIISAIDKFMAAIHGLEISEILTPHQRWFVRMYGKEILDAFLLLQKPKSIKEYREGWECFQQLHRTLMEETHKVRVLELSEVSPYLYNLKNTSIGMPGHSDLDCYIDSFGSNVIVIPTKTKPKKLDFKGSDGKKYPYLFKGHEDLHLDERIMQLLTTTNGLLNENETTALRGMRARTYAVIPLRDRSGMIQWVNEATPLYALFKKWQKRESAAHMVLNNDKPNEAILHALSMRPTENFANKVYAALKAAGLRVSTNRRHWPKHILKKVYLELVKETPGDLLEKELYYSSSTAEEWINKSTSFARSLAVTSMIGYIIGLGDRHLDNMLVDFRSGEMIHIDYNVCFEKGRRLRVPELVPYRLTQNLHNALGIMGIDGPFRTAAEETLMVLRKHKEVLITLLDAFVYDPLVDWEYEAEEAGHRQMRELQRSLGLVATHINRNQTQLEHDHQTVAEELAALEENLHRWQIFGNDYLNEEEESEEEEDRDEQPATDQNENETAVYRVPSYILSKVRERLSCVKFIVTRSRSPLEGILPLLESIIIIEADEDNELRPAQKASKSVFDALTRMDSQLKKLEKQVETNQNYESDWTYAQLADFIKLIQTSYVEYCSSLKILEEFGPDSKASSTSAVPVTDEPKSEAVEDNDTEYTDDQNNEAAESQTNKLPKITHVAKIMKRIRSKLEGVDFGVQHRMSVSEQVSKTIEQATSADNLCLMYEGWTSWV
ncbi:hypothetical protein G6F37_010859 [Rhizopus arrhizus]|nr:hypothetical protein G6F38_010879 [Rhizopus arrhizus]KAG1152098.1 hypothetical protein G6F37_010859 [Rhizopus arrhizus]